MTVIVWDGKSLAADRMAITGGGMKRPMTKIERVNGALTAVTGSLEVGVEMREWFRAGADPEKFPESARKGEATLIVVDEAGVRLYTIVPFSIPVENQKCAFGSGRDFAEAAMYLGKDARGAVEVAAVFQSDCGLGVDVYEL